MKLLLNTEVTIGAETGSKTEVRRELTVRSTVLDCVNESDNRTNTGAVNIPLADTCELVAPLVVLGVNGLTSPICSNAATLLDTERGPKEFAIASATAFCKPAQNSGDLKAAPQSTEEWDGPGAVSLVISYRIRHICVLTTKKNFHVYFQQIAKQLAMR